MHIMASCSRNSKMSVKVNKTNRFLSLDQNSQMLLESIIQEASRTLGLPKCYYYADAIFKFYGQFTKMHALFCKKTVAILRYGTKHFNLGVEGAVPFNINLSGISHVYSILET